jgi:RNA polymerase sigma factor (sigma-70 family)
MADRQPGCLLQRIRNLAAAQAVLTLSDRELLERFAQDKDQAAFAALVERHGGMVLAVCRRVLGHVHDAEDACQAALLVLARKATSIRKHDSLPGWLHRVAYHVATDLRRDIARRRGREEPASDVHATITEGVTWQEVRTALDEELQRLPERFRLPILLCYLEGKTRDEAAQELGWSLGMVKGRLERGRERLRSRLVRRGLSLSAALFGVGIGESLASAAMPAVLAVSTAKAAVLLASGKPASSLIATSVANLVEGAVRIMWMTKLKVAAALLLAIAVIGGTGGTLALRTVAEPSEGKKPAPQETALPQEKAAPRKDAKAIEPAWGNAVNGLQIAIAPDWKGPVVFGERVRYRVLVRNVTAQEIGLTFGIFESVLPAVKSEQGQQIGRGIVSGRKVGVLASDKGHSLAINAESIITGTIAPGAVATITRPAFVTRPYREFSRLNELTESTVFTDSGDCLLTETMVFALAQSPTEKFAVVSGAVKLVIAAKKEEGVQ